MRRLLQCLALGHFAFGLLLLLAAGWFATAALRALPYLATGSPWTRLLSAVWLALTYALPLAALGAWLVILGRGLWSPRPGLRAALLWTHGALLAPGALALVIGLYAVGMAERSQARGGGLLSPVAYLPLLFGAPVVILALCSIAVALTVIPRLEAGKPEQPDN